MNFGGQALSWPPTSDGLLEVAGDTDGRAGLVEEREQEVGGEVLTDFARGADMESENVVGREVA